MILVEGTHYRRREDQSSLSPHPSKAIMDCIFCHEILSSFYIYIAVENKRECNYNGKGLRENGILSKKNTKERGETTATA